MGRHADGRPKGVTADERRRQAHIERAETLSGKSWDYVAECQKAVLPCSYCSYVRRKDLDKNAENPDERVVVAAKYDENGSCIKCHGTKVVPDVERQRWAAELIFSRVVPAPKAVELAVDDNKDERLAEAAKNLSNEEIDALLKKLG